MAYSSENPPKRGLAKVAYEYFRKLCPSREIQDLSYCPNYDWQTKAWICEYRMKPTDIQHWNFDKSCITYVVTCQHLKRYGSSIS